jgi:hypothetical protein
MAVQRTRSPPPPDEQLGWKNAMLISLHLKKKKVGRPLSAVFQQVFSWKTYPNHNAMTHPTPLSLQLIIRFQ